MKNKKISCDLKSCFLCKNSLKEWIPAIDANRQTFQFKKGELVFKEGETVKGVYFINKGIVKIHKKWGDDKELIIRIAQDGDIFGHRGLGSNPEYPVSATTLEPTTACFINLDFFNSTLKVNSGLLMKLMLFFADELQESERRMRNLAHMSVKGRVAQALLLLEQKFGEQADKSIAISLSKQDLSSMVGAAYETVFKVINELAEENCIRVTGKSIRILNSNQLTFYTQQV